MNELSTVADGVDGSQMKSAIPITKLFIDIGGVLLTNGWDHHARKWAATNFKLEWAESHLTLRLFRNMVRWIAALLLPTG